MASASDRHHLKRDRDAYAGSSSQPLQGGRYFAFTTVDDTRSNYIPAQRQRTSSPQNKAPIEHPATTSPPTLETTTRGSRPETPASVATSSSARFNDDMQLESSLILAIGSAERLLQSSTTQPHTAIFERYSDMIRELAHLTGITISTPSNPTSNEQPSIRRTYAEVAQPAAPTSATALNDGVAPTRPLGSTIRPERHRRLILCWQPGDISKETLLRVDCRSLVDAANRAAVTAQPHPETTPLSLHPWYENSMVEPVASVSTSSSSLVLHLRAPFTAKALRDNEDSPLWSIVEAIRQVLGPQVPRPETDLDVAWVGVVLHGVPVREICRARDEGVFENALGWSNHPRLLWTKRWRPLCSNDGLRD